MPDGHTSHDNTYAKTQKWQISKRWSNLSSYVRLFFTHCFDLYASLQYFLKNTSKQIHGPTLFLSKILRLTETEWMFVRDSQIWGLMNGPSNSHTGCQVKPRELTGSYHVIPFYSPLTTDSENTNWEQLEQTSMIWTNPQIGNQQNPLKLMKYPFKKYRIDT